MNENWLEELFSGDISGTKFNKEKFEEYKALCNLVQECFKGADVEIDINLPNNQNSETIIAVYSNEVEITDKNKKLFMEAINKSDHTAIFMALKGKYAIMFSIKGIWEE